MRSKFEPIGLLESLVRGWSSPEESARVSMNTGCAYLSKGAVDRIVIQIIFQIVQAFAIGASVCG